MNPVQLLEDFLRRFCPLEQPVLLALSGGADSLCLFYALLECRQRYPLRFHVAHVDHGWRLESAQEASTLEKLVVGFHIPFHSIRLNPQTMTRNLENESRQARYRFFSQLCAEYQFQGVLVGHHADDQSETILKRVLEGSHWSHFGGVRPRSMMYGMPVLRPFLGLAKKDIQAWLSQRGGKPFEDSTNHDVRFLRARMREVLLPGLSRTFGKEIVQPLRTLGEEAQELADYFDEKIKPFMKAIVKGPLGTYLDLETGYPSHLLELKYLIRKFFEQENLTLSRASIESITHAILKKAANRSMRVGKQVIWIDRQRLFIPSFSEFLFSDSFSLTGGCVFIPNWHIEVKKGEQFFLPTSWKEGWLGLFKAALPEEEGYYLSLPRPNASYHEGKTTISKWWNQHKIPAFLRSATPVIWHGNTICHEFLTGRSKVDKGKKKWIEVILRYQCKEL